MPRYRTYFGDSTQISRELPQEWFLCFRFYKLFPQDLYILKGRNSNNQRFFYEPDNQKDLGKSIVLDEKPINKIRNINNKLRIWDTKLSFACLKKINVQK